MSCHLASYRNIQLEEKPFEETVAHSPAGDRVTH